MNRIPYPDPRSLSAAKQAVLDNPRARLLNITRIQMHAPDRLWRALLDLAIASVVDTLIDPRQREVLTLRVAYLSGCGYELHHHLALARAAGLADAEIAALESGDFAALSPADRLVAQFTTEIVRDVRPGDELLAAMRARFSDERIFEMIAIIGGYMIIARFARTAEIENDPEAVTSWGNPGG